MFIVNFIKWLVGIQTELQRKQRAVLFHFFMSNPLVNGRGYTAKGSIHRWVLTLTLEVFSPLPGKHPVFSEPIKFVDN